LQKEAGSNFGLSWTAMYASIENDQDPEKKWFIMTGDPDNDL
jgi:hypothetical protein